MEITLVYETSISGPNPDEGADVFFSLSSNGKDTRLRSAQCGFESRQRGCGRVKHLHAGLIPRKQQGETPCARNQPGGARWPSSRSIPCPSRFDSVTWHRARRGGAGAPACLYGRALLGHRLTAGPRPLTPRMRVRVALPELFRLRVQARGGPPVSGTGAGGFDSHDPDRSRARDRRRLCCRLEISGAESCPPWWLGELGA